MGIFQSTSPLTFMNVFEQILEQMWGVRNLKVQMALKFLQQRQAVWNHPFITRIAPLIMWPTLHINTGSRLQCGRVIKTACLMAILIYTLTIFRWRLVGGGCLCSMEPWTKAESEGFEGISVEMTASISAAVMQSLRYLRRTWACRRPRFWNSMEWIQYNNLPTWGNIVFNACSSNTIFLLNTHMTTMGISVASKLSLYLILGLWDVIW